MRATQQVNAPIDVTFAVFSDIAQIQERITGIKKVEILSDVTQGVGTRWRETRIMFGQEATEEMEISALQPNQSYDVVAESRGTQYHTRYTFTEQQGGTRVDLVFSGKAVSLVSRLMSVFSFLFAGVTRKALEADMAELKAIAERHAVEG